MVNTLLLLALLTGPARAGDDAAILPLTAADAPATAHAGDPVTFHVSVVNAGVNVWTAAAGYELGELSGAFTTTRVPLGSKDAVQPGATKVFTFSGIAPAQTAAATFQLLRKASGSELPIGAPSSPWTVTVAGTMPPVAGLTAVAVSSSEIDLQWGAVAGAAHMRVLRRPAGAPASSYQTLADLPGAAVSYADAGLPPSTGYAYEVESVDASGTASPPSNEASATTLAGPPAAHLSGTTAVGNGPTTETIRWTTDISADGSVEYGLGSSYGSTQPQSAAGGTVHSATLTGLLPSMLYHYRIVVTANGQTTRTPDATFITGQNLVALTPPTALSARAMSRSSVALAWVPGTGQLAFDVERSPDNVSWTTVDALGASATSYLATGLSAGTRYYFRVDAVGDAGVGASTSAVVSALTFAPAGAPCVAGDGTFSYSWLTGPLTAGAHLLSARVATAVSSAAASVSVTVLQPPPAPGGLRVSAVSSTQLAVAWTAEAPGPGGPTEYRVQRSADGASFAQVAVVAGAGASSWQDSGLSPSTAYYYRVVAANPAGASAPSAAASATTLSTPPPAAPSGVTATASGANRVDVAWTETSANATQFKIERSLDGSSFSPAGTAGAAARSYSDLGLAPNTLYYYRVTASGVGGVSAPSSVAQARTADVAPATPVNVSAAVSGHSISVTWTLASTNETSVRVERSAAGGGWTALASLPARSQSYTDSAAVPLVSYTYRVTAINGVGASAASAASNAVVLPAPPPVLQCSGKLTTWSYAWNTVGTPNGAHQLWVKAYAASGATAVSSTITVTVNNTVANAATIAGASVSFASLTAGATVLGTVRLAAAVSAPAAVARLEFYDDGQLIGSTDSSAKKVPWDTTGLASGPHTLSLVAYDAYGSSKTASAGVVVIPPSELAVSAPVSAASGGRVGDARTLQVEFDDAGGAMPEDVLLDIRPEDTSNSDVERLKRADEQARGLTRAGLGVEITARGRISGAQIHHFKRPVTLRFGYQPMTTAADDSRVGVFFWDTSRNTWQAVPGAAADGIVTAQTDHLTTYAVFEVGAPLAAYSDVENLFVYPNPLIGGHPGTVHAEVGQADEFDVGVYDLRGRRVRSGSVMGPPNVGINGKPAYEYSWDTAGLGSGTYLCLVRARSGGKTLSAVKKFAVIK